MEEKKHDYERKQKKREEIRKNKMRRRREGRSSWCSCLEKGSSKDILGPIWFKRNQ